MADNESLKIAQMEAALSKQKRQKEHAATKALKVEAALKKDMTDLLNAAEDYEDLLELFCVKLKDSVGASGVYIARLQTSDDAEQLKYVAADKDNRFLVDNTIEAGNGVTFDLFQPEEEEIRDDEDEELDEDDDMDDLDSVDGDAKAEIKDDTKTVFVPNVLMGPQADNVHFHRLPRTGCYLAMHLGYEATLNDDVLEEAVLREQKIKEDRAIREEEEEEDDEDEYEEKKPELDETADEKAVRLAKEQRVKDEEDESLLLSELQLEQVEYALCLDTLDQNRRFTPEEVTKIKEYGKLLTSTLERIDRDMFKTERMRRAMLMEVNNNAEDEDHETKRNSFDAIAGQLEKLDRPAEEEDIQFTYRRNIILSMRKILAEFRTYNVFRGPLEILQALLYLLGYTQDQVSDSKGSPSWKKVRVLFNDELFVKLKEYDPRNSPPRPKEDKYATIKNIRKLIGAHEYEDVRDKNYPLAEMFGYVIDALNVKRQQKEERRIAAELAEQKRIEEEEERLRLEEEERERAELEAQEQEGSDFDDDAQ